MLQFFLLLAARSPKLIENQYTVQNIGQFCTVCMYQDLQLSSKQFKNIKSQLIIFERPLAVLHEYTLWLFSQLPFFILQKHKGLNLDNVLKPQAEVANDNDCLQLNGEDIVQPMIRCFTCSSCSSKCLFRKAQLTTKR